GRGEPARAVLVEQLAHALLQRGGGAERQNLLRGGELGQEFQHVRSAGELCERRRIELAQPELEMRGIRSARAWSRSARASGSWSVMADMMGSCGAVRQAHGNTVAATNRRRHRTDAGPATSSASHSNTEPGTSSRRLRTSAGTETCPCAVTLDCASFM